MRQIPLPIAPRVPPTFDDFAAGGDAALAALVAHLQGPLPAAAPTYLWGPSGSGKTHLLQALAERRQRLGEAVARFDAGSPLPWTLPEAAGLVVVDRCEALDAPRQHAAFSLFVDALGTTPIVAAGRVPPVDLPVREDLRTRLGWGHVYALPAPGEAQVRAALQRQAAARGIVLGDGVVDYLLTRFERDLAHLMPLLDRLDDYALAAQRPALTVPLLRRMLAETEPAP